MKFRTILTAAAIALLPVVATAATIVIPGAGTGPGANNSQWQSELTLHSSAPRAIDVNVSFHQGKNVLGPVKVTLTARETRSFADVAKTMFGVNAGSGALVIDLDDRNVRYLAATSRTFNTTPGGEFGQDVPAIRLEDAVNAGSIGSINGPSSVATSRFNFGVYAAEATTVKWELLRANGTVAATTETTYAAGEHAQYNFGVETLLGATPQNNDTIQGRVVSGSGIFFGSTINATGDPTFVPGIPTRDDIVIVFGVDDDENGTIDVTDADGDGVLDGTIELFTGAFPNFFRVVAEGEFGEPVQLELLSSPSESAFIDSNGTLRTAAFDGLKGKTGKITIRASAGGTSTVLTIPVRYR